MVFEEKSINSPERNFYTKFLVTILLFFFSISFHAQVVSPFDIRFQANQKGGIQMISNVALTCNGANENCGTFQNQFPPNGNHNQDGGVTMDYVDIDNVGSTFMSSSDSLALPSCSEVSWAGLYWSARIQENTVEYVTREDVKIKLNNLFYQNITADETIDVQNIPGNPSFGMPSYFCFKDITALVQASEGNGRFTLANISSRTGDENLFAAWTIVVVYRNELESLRNLTVFDGMGYVSGQNNLDIPISGFVTPNTGPVSFELGATAYEGDRSIQGDRFQFNGTGAFLDVPDPLRTASDFFNSTITSGGTLTPHRNPDYNNLLGFDNGIFIPDNSAFTYIGNSATAATIRVVTTQDAILPRIITSAIDVYQPDLRASVTINDLNGPPAQPGDILEYTVVGKNIGSDVSLDTYMQTALDIRTVYVPNSIEYLNGPFIGPKTDASGDDQAEYDAINKIVRTRVNAGADAINGGTMVNSPLGLDSAAIRFQVEVIDDCILLLCDTTLENLSFIFGDGEIGGYPYDNGGASASFDANGCPTPTDNVVTINAPNCTEIEITSNSIYCEGDSVQFIVPVSEYATYSWEGPDGFTSTEANPTILNLSSTNEGVYTVSIALIDSSCIYDNITDTIQVLASPESIVDSIVNISCNGFDNGEIAVTPVGIGPFQYTWNGSIGDSVLSGLSPGDYTLELIDSNNCTDTFTYSISEPALLISSASVLTDFNGFNVSCFADSNGLAEVTYSGGTSPYEVFWSNGDTTDIADSLAAGAYNVLVTDTNGCETNASVTLLEPTPLELSSDSIAVSCFGGDDGSIDLTVIGGVPAYTYSWSNAESEQDIDTLMVGDYSVLVTDLNGCTDTLTATVTQPAAPIEITETHVNVDCFGNATGSIDVTVQGGTAPYTYLWDTGDTTEDLNDLTVGTYTLTVTDTLNCIEVIVVEVTEPAAPLDVVLSVIDVACYGDSTASIDASVTGGTAPYTYLWSTTDTTEDLSGLAIGTYSITVTDTNACTFSISATVTQPSDSLFASLQVTDVDCFGAATGSIESTVSGGTAPYTYLWSDNTTLESISALTAGTYLLTVTDSLGCILGISEDINQPEGITLNHTQFDILCFGDATGSIDLTVSGGISPFTYLWSNGAVSEDLSGIPAGPYDIIVTDSNGCSSARAMSLSQPLDAILLSETHTDALCIGGDQGTIDLTVTGGTPDYTYLWNNNEITEDIVELVPGIYVGQVTDDNGCIDSITIEILDPSNTMDLSIVEIAVSCFEGSDGALDLTVVGGALPYSYNWSNTDTIQDLSGLVTGNYFVIVTDGNSCESFISGFVDQPLSALSATDSITDVICFGDSTGAIAVTPSGGTLPYSYTWSNGSTEEDVDSLAAGSYTLVITDDNLCTDTNTYIINEPLALVLGSDLIDATCFGDNDGVIDLTPAGGVAPYSYQWSNDSTTQDLDSLIAGDYSLVLTDDNLCTAEVTLSINEPAAPISVTADSSNISCFDGNDGFIDITVAGGNGSYSYVWSNAALTEDLTDLFVGTYTVDVQDFKGCATSLTMTLTQPLAPLSLSIDMTPVICFSEDNGTATVTASGGTAPYVYMWSNTEDSLFIDSLIAGDYSVVVTDSLFCADSITVTVTEPPILTAVADSIDVLCHGDSTGTVSVLATGGVGAYSYLWDTGTADTTAIVDSLPAGTYTVTVTDTNGCFFTTSTTINQPLAPLSGILDVVDNICFGESFGTIDATISGGTFPYTYAWSNDSTTAYIDSLAVGAYTLIVTDSNACELILDTVIVSPTLLVVEDTVSNVSCFGGNDGWIDLTVSEATAPYEYLWSNSDTLQDIDTLIAGTYEVTITDSNNCVTLYPVTVTEPLVPLTLTMDSINVFCFGDTTGSIDLSVTGGTPGYSYLWNIGDTLQDVDSLVTGTYQVIVTDTNQCVDSLSVFIDQPLAPIALSATQVDILCFGDATGAVDLTVSGGTPASTGYVFDWNSGAFATEDLTGIPFGPYAVLVTDSLLCSDTLSVVLTQPDAPIDIDFTILDVYCFGDSTGNVLADISGGTVPYAWNWDLPIVDTTLFIDSLPIGDYILNVIDSNNCVYQETATVTQPDAPLTVTYDEVLPSCFEYSDGELTLIPAGGTAPYSYLWNTGDTTISIDSLATGDFSAQIVDTLGCFTSIDIFLAEPPELQISLDVDTLSGCSPFVVQFTNTSNATANCEWDFGNGNTYTGCENVFNVYEEGGIYSISLTAYDDNGCFNDVTYNDFITVYQTPTAAMNVDPTYLYPDVPTTNITNESVGGDTFVWNMGDTPIDFMGFEPGAYTYSPNVADTFWVSLLAITDEGCTDSTQGFVAFFNDPFLYAPNSFTPDGNIVNDTWFPVFSSPEYVKRYNLDIYNRWGQLVFETTDFNQGWDGTFQGNPVQDGTYTWKINFRWYDQRAYELTGHITLIK